MTNEATPELRDNLSVRLPLYDKTTGIILPGYLEVDISVFIDGPRGLARRCRVVEFDDPTPEQEIDIVDRIISGLPMTPVYDVASLHPQEVQSTDIFSPYPNIREKAQELLDASNTWRRIPDFDNYEINPLGKIRNRWTRRVLEVEEECGEEHVEMHDKDGFAHYVNVRYISVQVYGK